jgi:sugar phosphate isomerase/epimerase
MKQGNAVALQLYTVRDQLEGDYAGTFEKIAAMGYDAVEIGGFGPLTTKEWNSLLRRTRLRVVGNHFALSLLEESLGHVVEFNRAIGNTDILVPNLPEERRKDAASFAAVARSLDIIGEKCRKLGMRLHYHNHSNEFRVFDGRYALDILRENTQPGNVWFELDTYWIAYGGEDPVKCIERFAGRCAFLHVKDMSSDGRKSFAEVGHGCLDFKGIIRAANLTGVEWLIVEQDVCNRPSLESARMSLESIKAIRKGYSGT